MRYTIFLLFLISTISLSAQESIIELGPNQSMIISGKGPGQDGAINPYLKEGSIATVENLGEYEFSVRLQKKGEILKMVAIKKGKKKEFDLDPGVELYFDTEYEGKAEVLFREKE